MLEIRHTFAQENRMVWSPGAAILAGLLLLVGAQVEAPAPPPKQADAPRNLASRV